MKQTDAEIAAEVAMLEEERAEQIAKERQAKANIATWANPIELDPKEFKKTLLHEIREEYRRSGKGIRGC